MPNTLVSFLFIFAYLLTFPCSVSNLKRQVEASEAYIEKLTDPERKKEISQQTEKVKQLNSKLMSALKDHLEKPQGIIHSCFFLHET
jgi:hypothetical protein